MRMAARQIDAAFLAFCGIAAILLVFRVAILALSPLDLHFDEAQYWYWSRDLDWGYFSKPPLIGWTIAATTSLFGDDPWAVRLASPIAHTLGAFALYALAARLYTPTAGAWAGVGWLLMPGVQFSAGLISTDALLLPLWCAALLAFHRFVETRTWGWAAALGAAAGFGMLAKYAMGYFPLCAAVAFLWSPQVRAALLTRQALAAWGIALAIVAPNAIWNAANSFATVTHTAENTDLGGALFHPGEALDFILSQAGVIGPILFVALAALLAQAARAPGRVAERERILWAFIAPPLAIIIVQALLTRAHANWAAAAYPAAIVLLAGLLSRGRIGRAALWGSAGVHAALGALLTAATLSPDIIDRFSDKRPRGLREAAAWAQTAERIEAEVATLAQTGPVTAIVVDHRAAFFELAYQWRDRAAPPAPLRMWVLGPAAGNHAEAAAPMRAADGERVLVVSMTPGYWTRIAGDFQSFAPRDAAEIPLGGDAVRTLALAEASGFAPAPRDAAFMADFR
ncbi:MAG: glycosyltransferase family 39 protein [Hyphomonadaceae bacterium]|nr:glycosyltransferase family 39 protein [Hyphomonadaceae bacterium]